MDQSLRKIDDKSTELYAENGNFYNKVKTLNIKYSVMKNKSNKEERQTKRKSACEKVQN